MFRLRRQPRFYAIGVAVATAILAGCGSTLPDSQKGTNATDSSDGQTFSGTLTTKPAIRNIHLTAGEAIRWWVKPEKPTRLDLAVATTQHASATRGLGTRTYSDYSNFPKLDETYENLFGAFSDDVPLQTADLRAYGVPIATTNEDNEGIRWNPLLFSDFEASSEFGDAAKTTHNYGTWMTFIAPATANYTLIIGGRGNFTSGFATNPPPKGSPIPSPFDNGNPTSAFTAEEWLKVGLAQIPFLYDDAGYPKEGFFDQVDSDSSKLKDIGPRTHRADLTKALTDALDSRDWE